jgi:hypothetical protein
MTFRQPPKPSLRTVRQGEVSKPQEFVPRLLMGDFKIVLLLIAGVRVRRERRWTTAGATPARELVRSTR